MKTYILDLPCKSRSQIQQWLSEDKAFETVEAFEDYYEFIEQVIVTPPDICFIRLGREEIPGFKAAYMALQINPDMQIVFISDDKKYAMDAFEIGAYGFLLCPVSREKFDEYRKKKSK